MTKMDVVSFTEFALVIGIQDINSYAKCQTDATEHTVVANGCGYEIGWDCEELTYQTAQNLQRATHLANR
jgi:hypothetical protein